MNEHLLIQKIQKWLPAKSSRVRVGIGDDAAVAKTHANEIVTTVDALVEGVHFNTKLYAPAEIGHKALAVNLSDMAAMGATPDYVLVSLGVRKGLDEQFFKEFFRGLNKLARKFKVDVLGGNISRSPKNFFADITVIGHPKPRVLLRSGAKKR